MPVQDNFDVAAPMRAFAEKSMEQTRAALDSFVTTARQTASAAQSQAVTAQSGAREVGELAVRFAEDNVAAAFDYAERLTRAKDAKEVTALHANYFNGRLAAVADQARELSRHVKIAGQPAQH